MKRGKTLFILILTLPLFVGCSCNPTPTPTTFYTVTFNPNGGTIRSGASSIQVKPGTSFHHCAAPSVAKDNKIFKYWTFDIEGTNKVEDSYKINNDIEVYAYLVDEYHTITFDENGGSITGEKTTRVKDGTLFSKCEKPTAAKENHNFKYWTFDASGKETIDTSYVVENDFTVWAQYREKGKIYLDAPEDKSIVSYGSTVISYDDEEGNITVSSSNPNVLTTRLDESRSCIYLDAADGNVEGTATVMIIDEKGSDSVDISVHHPTTIQEAGESFDYAIGRGIYDITLTFNYDNQDDLDTFFNKRIETRLAAPFIYNDYVWNKGTDKTNEVKLLPSDEMATKSSDIEIEHSEYYYKNLKNAAYELRHSKIQKRTEDHFAIDDAKKRLMVHNSETLFFALERGFRPEFDSSEIAVDGSIAQRAYEVYQKAREACADAFGTETTDDFMKVRQLYEWLMDNTHYDNWIVSDEFVDNFWDWTSYFAEGVFLNKGIAVCDGFSKALAIMGGIEGLPIIRSAGFADAGGHAWNYYHNDGKWYLICPTWSHSDNDADEYIDYNYSTINYQPFMAQSNYFYNSTYKTVYNISIDEGKTEAEAKAYAEKVAQQNNFEEALFTDVTKSSTPYSTNIYKTDVFDKTKGYDFDLNSNVEAEALGNAIPVMHEDFSINLSYGSYKYLQALYDAISKRMNPTGGVSSVDYSYTNCNIYIKF